MAPSTRRSSSNSYVLLTELVQFVRIWNRLMSETISRGGFSSASAYCRNWSNAASRLACFPLYSHAKQWRFPHVRPAFASGVLQRAALEAVAVPLGVRLRRSRLAEQPAQVDEVLLRRGAFLQLRGVPLPQ